MPQIFTASARTKTAQKANGGSKLTMENPKGLPVYKEPFIKRETKSFSGQSLNLSSSKSDKKEPARDAELLGGMNHESRGNPSNNSQTKAAFPLEQTANALFGPDSRGGESGLELITEKGNQNHNNSNTTNKSALDNVQNGSVIEAISEREQSDMPASKEEDEDNKNNSNASIIGPCEEDSQDTLFTEAENKRSELKKDSEFQNIHVDRDTAERTQPASPESTNLKVDEKKRHGNEDSGSNHIPSFDSTRSSEVTFTDPRQSQVFQMLTNLQKLRKEENFTDLTVKVQGAEFRCHRFVLASNSHFLKAIIDDYSLNDAFDDNEEEDCCGKVKRANKPNEVDGNTADKASANPRLEQECNNKTKSKSAGNDGDNDVTEGGDKRCQNLDMTGDNVHSPVGYTDRKTTPYTILLTGVRPGVFSKMLDFMYCVFDDVLTEENALEMLVASDTFQLPHLRRTCANFISETLSARNVFEVIRLCDSGYGNVFEPRITRRIHQVIRENFLQLSSTEEFLTLGRHLMISLVADSMLQVKNELEVLHALLKWVQFNPDRRSSDMTLMLQHIRFPLLTSRELDKLREIPLVKENSLAKALIEESRAYGNLDDNERMAWPRHNCLSRCLFSTRDFIIWTADRDKGIHFYSVIDGLHHKVTSFGELTASTSGAFTFDSTSSACCYGDKIFFSGGEFNTDLVWSVDTYSSELKVHAKLPRGRKCHSMVAARGLVYCLGGQDKRGYSVLEDVDAYIINKDMWVKVGHLAVPAYNMAAAISGGAIYLVGGIDHAGQPLKMIQCFVALRSGLYSAFKVDVSMPPSLLSARAVTSGLEGHIFIVCGHGEVYKFEPETNKLSHLATLKNLSENPRVRFGLAHVGGCLVVIGGHQLSRAMREPIRSVCLDIATKTEVRDYSPVLPGDIVNICLASKLSTNILKLFNE